MTTTTDISERGLGRQFRTFSVDDLETRAADDGNVIFDGVASVVGHSYEVRDKFGVFMETFDEGAFRRVVDHATRSKPGSGKLDVGFWIDHRHADVPMATSRAKTLALGADPNLRFEAHTDPSRPDVQIARSVVDRGEYREVSIGFSAKTPGHKETWNKDYTERRIHEVTGLFDISLVREGANTGGVFASVRSFDEWLDSISESELTEADIRRGFDYFSSLLPAEVEQVIEERTGSGLVVSNDLIRLWDQRRSA